MAEKRSPETTNGKTPAERTTPPTQCEITVTWPMVAAAWTVMAGGAYLIVRRFDELAAQTERIQKLAEELAFLIMGR